MYDKNKGNKQNRSVMIRHILNKVKHRIIRLFLLRRYYKSGAPVIENTSLDEVADRNILGIVTIAFNNELVIKHQILLLRKYLVDSFEYTVVDNSQDEKKSKLIQQICHQNDTGYIKLPQNPLQYKNAGLSPSWSNGMALNWAYHNYIRRRNYCHFGFIDHDVFPIRKTSIVEYLIRSPIYGLIQTRNNKWYLWPGFSFFRTESLKHKKINFSVMKGLDAGGGNWRSIYRKYNKESLPNIECYYADIKDLIAMERKDWHKHKTVMELNYRNNPKAPCLVLESRLIEFMGDWMHTFNASNWLKTKDASKMLTLLMKEII